LGAKDTVEEPLVAPVSVADAISAASSIPESKLLATVHETMLASVTRLFCAGS
jgi:hypothetical protein